MLERVGVDSATALQAVEQGHKAFQAAKAAPAASA
jgi:hypothetical protein